MNNSGFSLIDSAVSIFIVSLFLTTVLGFISIFLRNTNTLIEKINNINEKENSFAYEYISVNEEY